MEILLYLQQCPLRYTHILVCENNSLSCSNVVSASLGCVSSDPVSGSALPPNTVTFVSLGPRLKALRECPLWGFSVALN